MLYSSISKMYNCYSFSHLSSLSLSVFFLMLKTLKEFTSVAQAEVESLKLFYASVVSSLLFKFLYEVHNALFPVFVVNSRK